MKHVVKRKGHTEEYEPRKLYASVYAACLNCHYGEEVSEEIASTVLEYMNNFMEDRHEVTSQELRKHIIDTLEEFDEDIAMMYDDIMDIC